MEDKKEDKEQEKARRRKQKTGTRFIIDEIMEGNQKTKAATNEKKRTRFKWKENKQKTKTMRQESMKRRQT